MSTPRQESLRRLEEEVGVLIRRVRRVIAERALALHEDLAAPAYLIVAHLAEHGPTRARTLTEVFSLDKGAVSRQLTQLVELGLVERTPDPDDGRATLVSATDEALRRLADVVEHRRKWFDEQLGDWSDAELSTFASELARYNAALNS